MLNQLAKWTLLSTLLYSMLSLAYAAEQPDWNDSEIQWMEYEQGISAAKQRKKPIMMVFYADWCPTCHAYKNIFNKPAIISLAKQMVMIKVNVDQFPQLSQRYEYDGSYVPRSFVMNSAGVVLEALYPDKHYKYFIKSQDIDGFKQLMEKALAAMPSV